MFIAEDTSGQGRLCLFTEEPAYVDAGIEVIVSRLCPGSRSSRSARQAASIARLTDACVSWVVGPHSGNGRAAALGRDALGGTARTPWVYSQPMSSCHDHQPRLGRMHCSGVLAGVPPLV